MVTNDLKSLVLIITLIFLIAPAFTISYIFVYNRRKRKHIEEKELMKTTFNAEILKTQLEVQEQTMQTIGADLHDNIGQLLSLTSLTLNSIDLDDQARSRKKIDDAVDLMGRSIKEMRLLGKLLQGDQLLVIGLSKAIEYQVDWMERTGRYQISYICDGEMPAADNKDKDLIIFRILQEVLNNIIKHAVATEIIIELACSDNLLKLQIADNGVGFNIDELPAEQKGMGLLNISKRASIIGGEVVIASNLGEGTCIKIIIPYP